MTADYHERAASQAYKMLFSFIFLLGLPWVFKAWHRPMSPISKGHDDRHYCDG